MSPTVKKVIGLAFLLYLAAFGVYVTGNTLNSDPSPWLEDLRPWTKWDYASGSLLMIAVGFTLAAIWLQRGDDFENQMEE